MALHPLLPLRDVVVFPGQVESLFVGRPRSIAAVEKAQELGGTQRNAWLLHKQRAMLVQSLRPRKRLR